MNRCGSRHNYTRRARMGNSTFSLNLVENSPHPDNCVGRILFLQIGAIVSWTDLPFYSYHVYRLFPTSIHQWNATREQGLCRPRKLWALRPSEGGSTHVIASLLAAAEAGTNPTTESVFSFQEESQCGARQATYIEHWAKVVGLWTDKVEVTFPPIAKRHFGA